MAEEKFTPEQKESLATQVAVKHIGELKSIQELAKEFGLPVSQIQSALQHPAYKTTVESMMDRARKVARGYMAHKVSGYIQKVDAALEHNLNKKDMEAVKTVLKMYSVLEPMDPTKTSEGPAININFGPKKREEKIIEVVEVKSGAV